MDEELREDEDVIVDDFTMISNALENGEIKEIEP